MIHLRLVKVTQSTRVNTWIKLFFEIVFEIVFFVFYFVVGPSLHAKLVVMEQPKAWKLTFFRSHSLAGDRDVWFREGGYRA